VANQGFTLTNVTKSKEQRAKNRFGRLHAKVLLQGRFTAAKTCNNSVSMLLFKGVFLLPQSNE
jgi:hypothetical protein